jgi:S1-C subfamily serine protease
MANDALANWPLYAVGMDQGDELAEMEGERVKGPDTVERILGRHKPGDRLSLVFVRRGGDRVTATIALDEDPRLEVVPLEHAGGSLSAEQQRFRASWLESRSRP